MHVLIYRYMYIYTYFLYGTISIYVKLNMISYWRLKFWYIATQITLASTLCISVNFHFSSDKLGFHHPPSINLIVQFHTYTNIRIINWYLYGIWPYQLEYSTYLQLLLPLVLYSIHFQSSFLLSLSPTSEVVLNICNRLFCDGLLCILWLLGPLKWFFK